MKFFNAFKTYDFFMLFVTVNFSHNNKHHGQSDSEESDDNIPYFYRLEGKYVNIDGLRQPCL